MIFEVISRSCNKFIICGILYCETKAFFIASLGSNR